MTKVMWLGEDTEAMPGPSFTTWNNIKFPKDVAVDVTDAHMLYKAKGNLQFKVIEEMKQEESHGADLGESQTQGENKVEDKGEAKEKDYREREKGTGYSPVKKKVRKKKPQAQDRDSDPATTRIPTTNP